MIYVKDINISDKFGTSALYITFKIDDTHFNLDEYVFDLYKSYTPTEGFVKIASDIKDFQYIDTAINLFDLTLNYYYKVKVSERNNLDNFVLSNIIGEYKGKKPDNEALAILNIHDIYLKNIIKNKLILLKRKHFGQICTCFDNIRRRADSNNCTLCYGTKYTGGYYSPYTVYANYANTTSRFERFVPSEVVEDETPIQLWTMNYPIIQTQDILVNEDNTRFLVTNAQPTHKNFYIIRHIIQIQRLPKSNIVYSYPINTSI